MDDYSSGSELESIVDRTPKPSFSQRLRLSSILFVLRVGRLTRQSIVKQHAQVSSLEQTGTARTRVIPKSNVRLCRTVASSNVMARALRLAGCACIYTVDGGNMTS